MDTQHISTIPAVTDLGPALWEYLIVSGLTQSAGTVLAVDARDALSRTLTTNNSEGVMYGSALGISPDVLHDAPANAAEEYELAIPAGGMFKVRKLSTDQSLARMVEQLRQDHRLKQNVDYAYTLKYGCLHIMCSSVYDELLRQACKRHALNVISILTYE